jgi:prepilin-type N-terminal cleavage/methylation domain-containing protein
MKKAFTMIELVFVIVVIGILAAVIIPNTRTNPLYEAATQLVSHIRYTQHLAMVDDKFSESNTTWYRERWQMKFSKMGGSDNRWAYTIYSDFINQDGVPNANETAVNPLDSSKRLTGGYSGTIEYGDSDASNKLNLGHSFSINDIDFLNGCSSGDTQKWLSFDHLGRPLYRNMKLLDSLYKDGSISRLVTTTCKIEICTVTDCSAATSDEKVTIAIEPETGYAHIL